MEREGAPVDPIGGSANATRSEIALPDGAVIELERTEFTARRDTVEAKVQSNSSQLSSSVLLANKMTLTYYVIIFGLFFSSLSSRQQQIN